MRITAKLDMHQGPKSMTYVKGEIEATVSVDGVEAGKMNFPYRILGVKKEEGEVLRAFATGWGKYNDGKSTIAPYSDNDVPKFLENLVPADEVFLACDAAGEGWEITLDTNERDENGEMKVLGKVAVTRGMQNAINPSVQAKLAAYSAKFAQKAAQNPAGKTMGTQAPAVTKTPEQMKEEAKVARLNKANG